MSGMLFKLLGGPEFEPHLAICAFSCSMGLCPKDTWFNIGLGWSRESIAGRTVVRWGTDVISGPSPSAGSWTLLCIGWGHVGSLAQPKQARHMTTRGCTWQCAADSCLPGKVSRRITVSGDPIKDTSLSFAHVCSFTDTKGNKKITWGAEGEVVQRQDI